MLTRQLLAESSANSTSPTASPTSATDPSAPAYDLRDFERWIVEEFAPSVRLPGGAGLYARTPSDQEPELYGVADMACILYTLGILRPTEAERAEWRAAFQLFQNPDTGLLVEKSPSHDALHNTAFALAAMQLLNLNPEHPVKMEARFSDIRGFLNSLDWRTKVYPESHKGAGVGSIFALVPAFGTPPWFGEFFSTCDAKFDPRNGLMGEGKPPGGDFDQIGGTFHYQFLYEHFNRHLPFPERRIDSVIGLQQPDGYWHPSNHLWLTLDALFLMTRTLRYCPYRFADVQNVVRRTMDVLMNDVYSPAGRSKTFVGKLAVHSVTAAISIAAEAQRFLGAQHVITTQPLKLVLDRRPFI